MRKIHLTLSLFLLFSGNALCQIEGDVRDKSNKRISGAVLVAMDTTKSVVDSVIADENGFYAFSNLKPGKYFIEAKAPGFQTRLYKNVEARARMEQKTESDVSNASRLQIVLTPIKNPKQ